jgi:hypothetical protein
MFIMMVLGIDLDRCIKSVLDGEEEWWAVIVMGV